MKHFCLQQRTVVVASSACPVDVIACCAAVTAAGVVVTDAVKCTAAAERFNFFTEAVEVDATALGPKVGAGGGAAGASWSTNARTSAIAPLNLSPFSVRSHPAKL